MSLPIPSSPKEVIDDAKTDVQRLLSLSNPNLPNSWINALIVGFSNRIFDNYQLVQSAIDSAFYDTSKGDFLVRQASWYDIFRLDPTQASGQVMFTGTDTTIVPIDTEFTFSNGVKYKTQSPVTITQSVRSILNFTPSGRTVTATMNSSALLVTGMALNITSSNPDYNGVFPISVLNPTQFTFEISEPSVVITTLGSATWASGEVYADSIEYGSNTNVDGNSQFSIVSQIAGVDTIVFALGDGMTGGSDLESDEDLRKRFLYRVANPISNFNISAITSKALEVAGVTRVFVKPIYPALGQVTVYFMRDNDSNTIPSPSEVTEVKNKILEIKPANTSDADVIVLAPTAVTANFNFATIDPYTETMKNSIIENLREFFATYPQIGESVPEAAYKTAIYNTIDTVNGDTIYAYELTAPIGDITVGIGEIAILGTVVFV